jgi:L-fuconolactonase
MGGGIAPDAGWTKGITALAALPNVWCKLSGMVTEIGDHWSPADLTDHARQVLDSFGPARMMWGSDWPVVNLASSYVDWYVEARKLVDDLSAPEQAQIFGGTAQTFYGLVTP